MKLQSIVPLPERMAHLDKDKRGYPIPVIIEYAPDGTPMFTVNSEAKRQRCLRENLCAVCGNKLDKTKWLLGGPGSALHPEGWFNDTPLHEECMDYSARVCPYLALPSFTKLMSPDYVEKKFASSEDIMAFLDTTMDPEKPPLFVAVECEHLEVQIYGGMVGYVRPVRPHLSVRFYKDGKRLSLLEGTAIARNSKYLKNARD